MPQGGEFRVNTFTTGIQDRAAVAMDASGNFVVAWQSVAVHPEMDVFARRFNAEGVPQGNEFRINTYTTDKQRGPSVAMDAGGDFIIAWTSDLQDGSGSGIFAQRYNAAGVTQGDEFRMNTYTYGSQDGASIAMDAVGDFVVAWTSSQPDGFNVVAQRYGRTGASQGAEFRVSTSIGFQMTPKVTMDNTGGFTVAWQGYPQDESSYGIYARRYNSAGVAQSDEFRVNSFTTNAQGQAAIAMDASGDFVVAWQSDGQDGSGDGIFAQRYAVVPEVTSSLFLFDSAPQRLRFRFNHDVRDSLCTDDLLVQNLTTGQIVPATGFALLYDPASDVATFIYVGAGGDSIAGVLPDGNYRATLRAEGIATPQGASPASDHVFDFFFLNADANRDGIVNLADFNIVARHFGQSGTDFARGDFTYDGTTDLEDFNILSARFGVALPINVARGLTLRGSTFGQQIIEDEDRDSLLP